MHPAHRFADLTTGFTTLGGLLSSGNTKYRWQTSLQPGGGGSNGRYPPHPTNLKIWLNSHSNVLDKTAKQLILLGIPNLFRGGKHQKWRAAPTRIPEERPPAVP